MKNMNCHILLKGCDFLERPLSMNIRYLRKSRKMSQEEFSELFGVSRQCVAKWENGESVPDVYKLEEIATHYDVPLDFMLNVNLQDSGSEAETSEGRYIFGLVKVGDRGQVVIPKYAREVFNINAGDRLAVFGDTMKGGIALAKVSLSSLIGRK